METEDEKAEEARVTGAASTVREGGGAGRGREAVAGDAGADEGVDCGEGGGSHRKNPVYSVAGPSRQRRSRRTLSTIYTYTSHISLAHTDT